VSVPSAKCASPAQLRLVYFACLLSPGILLPFLPAFLRSRGLLPGEIGLCLSAVPLLSIASPHLWGFWADRTHRLPRLLAICCAASALGYVWLAHSASLSAALVLLAMVGLFQPAISPLLDTLVVHSLKDGATGYPGVRAFGSLGFALSTVSFGILLSDRIEFAPLAAAACLGLSALLIVVMLPAEDELPFHRTPLRLSAMVDALFAPGLLSILLVGILHWVACAPYHGSLALHFASLGLSNRLVGLASGLGVASEVLVLYFWKSVAVRVTPKQALVTAFSVSVFRWLGMAWFQHPVLLVGLSLLHGLSFGAFAVAAIALLSQTIAPTLRASGQALWASSTFGVGGVLGFFGAGPFFEAFGGRLLFVAAAVVDCLALALVLRARVFNPRISGVAAPSAPQM
jgi:MFS transporter, PPP family, 3-phenylpropionic acid transporter